MPEISKIRSPDGQTYDIKDAKSRPKAKIYYCEGPNTDTTPGHWTGTINGIDNFSDIASGTIVVYVPYVAGGETGTTLNINNTGDYECKYTRSVNLTTQYGYRTPIMLMYDLGYWYCVGIKEDDEAHIYYVEGPNTDATAGHWSGTIDSSSFKRHSGYYDGLTVLYVPHVAGASTTYLNINGLGDIVCYYTNTTKLTTHYSAGTPILLTYKSGYWRRADYDSNTTTISNLNYANGNWIANSAIYRYQLLFEIDENRLTPLNNVNNGYTNTSKSMLTSIEFNPFGHIFMYNKTDADVSANGEITASYLVYSWGTIDSRYTFNHGSTLTANAPLYLKVTMLNNGKCKIASSLPLVQTLPSSDDGYYYILLGRTYSTYEFSLYPIHPVYHHDGTNLYVYNGSTVEVSKLLVDGNAVIGGSLTINNSSTPMMIAAAAGKAVDTSVAANSASTNVPTSAAVSSLVLSQRPFHIWVNANSTSSYTITDSRITADHRVMTETIVRSTSDINWTTATGTCTLSCTAGIPEMDLCFYLP